jgi:hypothetical protein
MRLFKRRRFGPAPKRFETRDLVREKFSIRTPRHENLEHRLAVFVEELNGARASSMKSAIDQIDPAAVVDLDMAVNRTGVIEIVKSVAVGPCGERSLTFENDIRRVNDEDDLPPA